ncbi:MAG: hypothetical protein RI100_06625 [Nitrosarchaeum sp.]|jgi:hypothetical protein|uniref:hypothetical protein n=1 Tax=Nitrosarchaeum sp. TaxID=2026886 RepID=UPI002DF6D629|nr:hypothetical protein [Nitrosarchaeum sp.]
MRSQGMSAQSDRLGRMPSLGSLAKISVGLILIAIVSSAFVYAETSTVEVNGVSYDVDYTGTEVTVSSMTADADFVSLIIEVDVTGSPGTLEITLDRNFFDSVYQGEDDDFIVLVDGDEPEYSETNTTDQSRTLSISLPFGTEEIEIIGSQFGSSEDTPVEEEVIQPEEEVTPPVEEEVIQPEEEEETIPTPIEKPVDEKPKTECGPGTILQDGVCVLDERCGPGTVLEDGACVVEPVTESEVAPQGLGKQLVIGVIAGFIIAGIVGLVLAIMSKASKSK